MAVDSVGAIDSIDYLLPDISLHDYRSKEQFDSLTRRVAEEYRRRVRHEACAYPVTGKPDIKTSSHSGVHIDFRAVKVVCLPTLGKMSMFLLAFRTEYDNMLYSPSFDPPGSPEGSPNCLGPSTLGHGNLSVEQSFATKGKVSRVIQAT